MSLTIGESTEKFLEEMTSLDIPQGELSVNDAQHLIITTDDGIIYDIDTNLGDHVDNYRIRHLLIEIDYRSNSSSAWMQPSQIYLRRNLTDNNDLNKAIYTASPMISYATVMVAVNSGGSIEDLMSQVSSLSAALVADAPLLESAYSYGQSAKLAIFGGTTTGGRDR